MRFDFSKISDLSERMGFRNDRPPFEGLYIYVLLFFVGYLIADVSTLYMRGAMLPTGGVVARKLSRGSGLSSRNKGSQYSGIKEKNIFNADHKVPPALGENKKGGIMEDSNDPVKSSLPLNLVGTLVHGRAKMSVATIQVKGKKEVEPYKVGEEIKGMAEIKEIVREKVIFRNLRSRKLEFIKIKEDSKLKLGLAGGSQAPVAQLDQSEQTSFTFKRDDINKHLENLPQVLQDAKAIPHVEPSGEVGGFKLVAIKPGSIYEKLGLKRNDIIRGVNGEMVDTPQKAMELYQALKNADSIQLEVTRGGSSTTLNYSIE